MMGWQWHQLDHLQVVCTLLQTDNRASTSSFVWSYNNNEFLNVRLFDCICMWVVASRIQHEGNNVSSPGVSYWVTIDERRKDELM